jgi:hypothetical protein
VSRPLAGLSIRPAGILWIIERPFSRDGAVGILPGRLERDYLMFVWEAPLPNKIEGVSDFAESLLLKGQQTARDGRCGNLISNTA